MTTTVYVDLDGTLLEYSRSFADCFAQAVPVDPTDELFETYSEQVLAAIADVHEDPYERAFAAVCDRYDVDADPAALAADYVEIEASATRIRPPVRRLVETLGTRHRVGILTNGDGRMQRRKLAEHGLDDLADAIVVSNEVGVRKPDREIFEEAKRRLPADTYVYVGDTYEEDIVPAREADFQPVYVGDEPQPDAPVAAADTEALASLLLPLLDGNETEPR